MFGVFCRRNCFYLQHQILEHLKKSQTLSEAKDLCIPAPRAPLSLELASTLSTPPAPQTPAPRAFPPTPRSCCRTSSPSRETLSPAAHTKAALRESVQTDLDIRTPAPRVPRLPP